MAIEKGYDNLQVRAHRVYLLFLRYGVYQGSIRIAYLRANSTVGMEQEIERLKALNASVDQRRMANLVLLSFENRFQEVVELARGSDDERIRVVRWNALLQLARDDRDEAPKRMRTEEAMAEITAVTDSDPTNYAALFLGAQFMMANNQHNKAFELAQRLLENVSLTTSDAFLSRAVLLEQTEDQGRLLENLAAAQKVDPEDPLACAYLQALALGRKDDIRKAPQEFAVRTMDLLSPIVAREPPFPGPYVLLGVARVVQGRLDEAEKLFDHVRTRFVARASWGDPEWWGSQASLAAIINSAKPASLTFRYECVKVVVVLNVPDAEDTIKHVDDALADPQKASASSLDKKQVTHMRTVLRRHLAALSFKRGDVDAALNHVKTAVDVGANPDEVWNDKRLEKLRNDQRFRKLCRK